MNWSVDGAAGGNSTVGTVSASGIYTPPGTAGTHTVTATSSTNPSFTTNAAVAVTDLIGVTTYHNDLARTGQNLQEYALTPSTVSSGQFGKRWSCAVDGSIYAQPLYVANLSIRGGTHNVLFVATMHDSVYAFDADNPGCVIYWQAKFLSSSTGITTQSSAAVGCSDVEVEYGILGTPVIDPVAQTIYVVASTAQNGNYFETLHALNITTGAEQANSPVVIQATVQGTGDGSTTVTFDPINENQRPGLLLTGGGVFVGWSSHCDTWQGTPWHGWFFRYDATSLNQTAVFNVTPNGYGGGIWMSAGAPAVDSTGSIFLSTGNGTFDDTNDRVPPAAQGNDFGMSFVNLNPSTLIVQDFFTPSQNVAWTALDYDIAAAGMTILPDGLGPSGHPNVLVGADKQGHLYMIDRTQMSLYSAVVNNVVQFLTLPNILTGCFAHASLEGQCVYSTPGYWNGTVYISVDDGPLMALPLSGGLLPANAGVAVPASRTAETYGFPAPTPSISAVSSGGGIVWVLDNSACYTDDCFVTPGVAILRAYDATNLGTTLYSSATRPADAAGNAIKFTSPVVANGHVYIGGDGTLTVYGLSP
jgi:hypothetical protein